MKKLILTTGFFLAAFLLASWDISGNTSCFDSPMFSQCADEDGHQNTDQQKKTVYTCLMHPEILQDKPGKCPKCGMNLVVKETKKEQFTCPMHPEVVQDKAGKCPKCGMALVLKEAVKNQYTCPMHSEVIQDKPGKCPKCGMNLVLKQPDKKEVPVKK